jgi:AcrR family transcriptional regulator
MTRKRTTKEAKAGKSKGTGAPRLGEPTLTAADWAEAALQLIAEAGLGKLTVDTLAKRLGVTKGSFYWHFKGRSDLLAAALDRWEQRSTGEPMKALNAFADPRRRLSLLIDASLTPPRARSLYAALAEAAEDPVVGSVLNRVATARVDYLEACYKELGLAAPLAKATAVFAYAAYRGLLQLAHEAPGSLPDEWATYTDIVRKTVIPAEPTAIAPATVPTATLTTAGAAATTTPRPARRRSGSRPRAR